MSSETTKSEIKKRKVKRNKTYGSYIKKIAKKEDPDIAIGKKAVLIIDQMISDIITRTTTEASKMSNKNLMLKSISPGFKIVIRDKQLQEEMDAYAMEAVKNFIQSKKESLE